MTVATTDSARASSETPLDDLPEGFTAEDLAGPDPALTVRRVLTSEWLLVPAVLVLVVVGWELAVGWFDVKDYILPPPSAIWESLRAQVKTERFWSDVRITAREMGLGYFWGVATAMVLGLAVSQVRILEKALMPYVVAFQAIPKSALAPLFLLWFGFGEMSKVVTAALSTFFPVLITVIEGLNSAGRQEIAMLRSLDAGPWQIFRYVKLPNALPFIFAGMNIGIIFALIGAVVGEFVGAQGGLGYRVLQMNYQFDIAGLFATLISLSILGLVPYYVLRALQRRLVFWGDSRRLAAS